MFLDFLRILLEDLFLFLLPNENRFVSIPLMLMPLLLLPLLLLLFVELNDDVSSVLVEYVISSSSQVGDVLWISPSFEETVPEDDDADAIDDDLDLLVVVVGLLLLRPVESSDDDDVLNLMLSNEFFNACITC